ncbi:OmpA family protein [Blattabacterium cuenoti]|uniref:OmpA family protein n=1 Tax=Blattabacterium cuenoti TaxID=1653831 RepID=UPI00163C7CD3|nr:OmpA family protein [Blattabacterium cuenoti]
MKNVNFFIIVLFTLFSSIFFQVFSKDSKEKEKEKWFLKIGTHDINYFPITSPFRNFFMKRNNSFNPIISNLELEYNIKKHIGLYLNASSGMIDNTRWRIENGFFFKLSNGVNLYIFPHYKLDPYLRLGAGYHKFNGYIERELRISETKYFKTNKNNFFIIDGGLGLNFWIVSNFGINAQSTYNKVFAYQSGDYLNFWKHNLGVIFRFGNLKFNKYKYNKNQNDHKEHENKKIVEINKDHSYFPIEGKEKKEEEKIFCNNKNQKDSDNDGVLDKEDLCSNKFGLKKFKGCPDTDSDNIPDNEDKCPKEFGKKENKGCPDIVFSPILFDFKKFKLSHRYLIIVHEIAKIMINKIPHSKFYIDGYTDSHGKFSYNKILSLKRANSVFKVLVSKGVDASRINVRVLVGAKYKNKGRRVEITIRKS